MKRFLKSSFRLLFFFFLDKNSTFSMQSQTTNNVFFLNAEPELLVCLSFGQGIQGGLMPWNGLDRNSSGQPQPFHF